MNLWIPHKTPKILKQLFSNYIWDFTNTSKTIYLTFDDGPIPKVTEFVLEQLSQYNAKATFFCIGNNIQKHPEIFNQIIAQEHAIGNHTMNHIKAWKSSTKQYIDDIMQCEYHIQEHYSLQDKTKLFRPPYGQISLSKFKNIKALGYKIILWDVLSKDWDQSITTETCLKNTIKHTKEGSIIVFHDSVKASKNLYQILPPILQNFTEKGFKFERIEA